MGHLGIAALTCLAVGVLLLGIYIGEGNIIRRERHNNRIYSEGPDQDWWLWGVILTGAGVVMAILAANI